MSAEAQSLLLLLLGLQVKHLLGDFVLQRGWMLEGKGRYGAPGGLAHAGLHGALTLPVLALLAGLGWALALALALGEAVLHYHIDWGKDRWMRRTEMTVDHTGFWMAMGVDQFLHQLTYVAIILIALLLG